MRPIIQEIATSHTPESLVERLRGEPGLVLLRSALFEASHARYSMVAANPFLTVRSSGSRCELAGGGQHQIQFGNPWHILDGLMARYELLDEIDLPFPLGGCFGFWGYDLKNFVEPKLPRRVINDLELPDCHVGFHDSLVVFDHRLGKTWIVSTGLDLDGSRSEDRAQCQLEWWRERMIPGSNRLPQPATRHPPPATHLSSNVSRPEFIAAVERAQKYIRAGDIYQVNLSQRLAVPWPHSAWELYERLAAISPAPFAAWLDAGDFQIASSSPELFLRLTGAHILTRPIKGTRPRSADAHRDAQLTYELQTSPKEMSELVMITDLLRNDLGKVCEYGSVNVPELVRLERYPQVQHLVSTVEGRLRPDVTHFRAFASSFPGGSITGAPKIRAMEIIDELEAVARGPYTGAIGYLGFNRESQLSITIRTAVLKDATAYFGAGAGIVADSDPSAEYDETLAKARGFLNALNLDLPGEPTSAAGRERETAPGTVSAGQSRIPPPTPVMIVFLNGAFLPEDRATVSVLDRGFLYGDGLFETIPVQDRRPFRWSQHFERLQRGADFLGIRLPYSPEELRRHATALLEENQVTRALLRVNLSRGVGPRGYSPKGADSPTLVMTLHPAPPVDPTNPPGWRLVTASHRLPTVDPLSSFKTSHKLLQVLARAEADAGGADDALLLNTDGEVAETSGANIFWVERDAIHTTPSDCGALPGVTRAVVIELCQALGWPTQEKSIELAALKQSDGIFLALSSWGIVPVSSIDGKPVSQSPRVGQLCRDYWDAVARG